MRLETMGPRDDASVAEQRRILAPDRPSRIRRTVVRILDEAERWTLLRGRRRESSFARRRRGVIRSRLGTRCGRKEEQGRGEHEKLSHGITERASVSETAEPRDLCRDGPAISINK